MIKQKNLSNFIKILFIFLLLVPQLSMGFTILEDGTVIQNSKKTSKNISTNKIKKGSNRTSVIDQIRFINDASHEIDFENYMKPLKNKKIRPEIAISRDGSTVVTIQTIEDKDIQEFRLWKIEMSDKDPNLKSFGAFQIDLAAFEIDIPSDPYTGDLSNLPFSVNAVYLSPSSFEDRQKITLSELAISDDGSKIAFAFRNQDRSAIDLTIFQTQSGEQEISSQVFLDEKVQLMQANIPLTCGISFHPIKPELILCRGSNYDKDWSHPLDFHLSSIDLNTGKVLLNGNGYSSNDLLAFEVNNPIELGLYPTGTLKISKDGKYITTNANGFCSVNIINKDLEEIIDLSDSKNKNTWCYKFSTPLVFRGDNLSIDLIDPLENFDLFLKNLGANKDYWEFLIRQCYDGGENNCLQKYIYTPYTDKLKDLIKNRDFGFPVALEYLPNGYTTAVIDDPDNGYYYYDGSPSKYEYTEQKVKTFPDLYYDIEAIAQSSNPLIALSNDEKIILLIDENDDRIYFHLKDQTPTIISKVRSNKLYTALTPIGDHGFLMLGYEIKHVWLPDSLQYTIDTANLQKKGIELLQAGFEEEALETLVQSYFNDNSWWGAPYLTIGSLLNNTRCHDVCNNKRTTELPIEFKLSLISKIYSQKINNNLTPSLEETSEQKAERLDNLSYYYINYAIMASYNGQMGLVEQAINKLEPLLTDPANTKLGFADEHYAMLNLLKANLIAQTDLKKAYSFLLQQDNIAKAYNWNDIGMLETVQTLKQDRKKFCYVLELSEEDCGSKYLDIRDYKNHDFYDLNGDLIQGAKIDKSLSEMKEETPQPTDQEGSSNAVTILD